MAAVAGSRPQPSADTFGYNRSTNGTAIALGKTAIVKEAV
jgi:hypothetical protein